MATKTDSTHFTKWHELLDQLCMERGYFDNLHLANRLCVENGNQSQEAFNTAAKNLRNWRHGVHIPQRRNFALLGKILEIDDREGLRRHWNALYREARGNANPGSVATSEEQTRKRWPLLLTAVLGIALVSITGASGILAIFDADSAKTGFEGTDAGYRRNITLAVGDALIVHGARGNDCGPAPDWETVESQLPQLITGTLTDGGVGTRFSRQCGGRVPARAILFTATTPGVEQTALYGDPITITVQ